MKRTKYLIYLTRDGEQYFVRKKFSSSLDLISCPLYAKEFTAEMAKRIMDAYTPKYDLKVIISHKDVFTK